MPIAPSPHDPSLCFRPALPEEVDAVVALWNAAKEEPHSVWNSTYPTAEDAHHDRETGNLYVLYEDGRGIIGTLSVCPENEMDDMDCFTPAAGTRELARVAVAADRHGCGYAAMMATLACDMLAARGVPAVRISVARDNLPARRTYPRAGFSEVGEAFLWEDNYVLMEKMLTNASKNERSNHP